MHDPLHVVFEIRRPPLTRRERKGRPVRRGRDETSQRRAMRHFLFWRVRPREMRCYSCEDGIVQKTYESLGIYEGDRCKDCAGRGYHLIPPRRRLMFSTAHFYWRGREWYLPGVVTLWHRDPEFRGDDDSCRRPYDRKAFEARKDGRWLQAWFWRKCSARYGFWHVTHWHWQVMPVQSLKRWLFSRCAGCGKRMPFGYSPISGSWDGPGPMWFKGEPSVWHHECHTARCAKAAAPATPV